MTSYLDRLLAGRRADVESKRLMRSLATVRGDAATRPAARDFASALRGPGVAIVAEIKRASPSAGIIAAAADAGLGAKEYETGGAAALSVLTEPHFFGGSLDDLRTARNAVAMPALCKDFVVDEYQIWEAAAAGADAVLLIAAALTDAQLEYFASLAVACAMAPLVEVHDEGEVARVLRLGSNSSPSPTVIGINNRNLNTMIVDTMTAVRLRRLIPSSIVVVAESGYSRSEDLEQLAAAGIDAVLIGETLMRQPDRAEALRRFRGVAV